MWSADQKHASHIMEHILLRNQPKITLLLTKLLSQWFFITTVFELTFHFLVSSYLENFCRAIYGLHPSQVYQTVLTVTIS